MIFPWSHTIWMGAIAASAVLSGEMALRDPVGPVCMSAMRIAGLEGYSVSDWNGVPVGTIASVETDDHGRTRWLNIRLHKGGLARVASFRADLDASRRTVSIRLPESLLLARVV